MAIYYKVILVKIDALWLLLFLLRSSGRLFVLRLGIDWHAGHDFLIALAVEIDVATLLLLG